MDVKRFADELLVALAATGLFRHVSLQTEGPIASGRAFLPGSTNRFLRIYFNESTGTMAFALISNQQRIWGVDFDYCRMFSPRMSDVEPTCELLSIRLRGAI